MNVQGGKISASKINIQNWCNKQEITHVGGEKNASKISVPSLCISCYCGGRPCYCCGTHQPQNCWTLQSDCTKKCH